MGRVGCHHVRRSASIKIVCKSEPSPLSCLVSQSFLSAELAAAQDAVPIKPLIGLLWLERSKSCSVKQQPVLVPSPSWSTLESEHSYTMGSGLLPNSGATFLRFSTEVPQRAEETPGFLHSSRSPQSVDITPKPQLLQGEHFQVSRFILKFM